MKSQSYKKHRGWGAGRPIIPNPTQSEANTEVSKESAPAVIDVSPSDSPQNTPISDQFQADPVAASRTCAHKNAAGRSCRRVAKENSEYCYHHTRQAQLKAQSADRATAAELLRGVKNFSKPRSVNRFLGNVVKELVNRRVTRRDAIAMAYLSQLLLNTFPHINKQLSAERDAEGCKELLDSIRPFRPDRSGTNQEESSTNKMASS
jgi:hypothetical protein